MPDQPLPEQLRASAGSGDSDRGTSALMRAAAEELERLEAALTGAERDREVAEHGRDYYAERLATAVLDGGPDAEPIAGLVAELVGDAGVPSPMPQPRRFGAHYEPAWVLPAPGSFVYAGPALAVWRVLHVDELAGHATATHVFTLEAVDGHDVPMQARVMEVPMPIEELPPADVPAGPAAS